ncbi:MAG TPA: PEP-CTERM sorting domain-containing protein [Anaerohalosphaeraceae bacterium]|nr:PEP-CTERM sorting domain-containing protein [Anaerohalosphaeraceae bacterium]
MNNITAGGFSVLEIKNTTPYAPFSGGIGTLNLGASSELTYSGGQINTLTISGSATAILSGGQINKIHSYQMVNWWYGQPVDQHIKMIVKDYAYNDLTKKLTGTWGNNTTFNIQLVDQTGYDSVINNINFTIIPEPATMLLLGLGCIYLRRRQ